MSINVPPGAAGATVFCGGWATVALAGLVALAGPVAVGRGHDDADHVPTSDCATVYVGAVAPMMPVHVLPPSAELCHW